jgi:hypothetical protein
MKVSVVFLTKLPETAHLGYWIRMICTSYSRMNSMFVVDLRINIAEILFTVIEICNKQGSFVANREFLIHTSNDYSSSSSRRVSLVLQSPVPLSHLDDRFAPSTLTFSNSDVAADTPLHSPTMGAIMFV